MYTATDADALVNRLKAEGKRPAEIVRQLAVTCLGWPYVYAAAGEMCTTEWRKNRMRYSDAKYAAAIRDACPVLSGTASSCAGCKWEGCRCFDCRGFTRWLLEQAEITLAGGGATSQWDAASNWVAKGTIDTMPKGLVCCVFKRKDGRMSHTGMSMGDGAGGVIHCSTTVKRGNAYTDYSKWTHWAIPKGLYSDEELRNAGINVEDGNNLPTLRRGSQGEAVKKLQTLLNEQISAGLNPDGIFGAKTENALRHFQELNGLADDGVCGKQTWQALTADEPPWTPEKPEQETVAIPLEEWRTIKSAIAAAAYIIKKYE